mgnify:CR=1 FL=1
MLFTVTTADDQDQILLRDTQVTISVSGSTSAILTGETSYEIQNTIGSGSPDISGATVTQFIMENALAGADESVEVVITIAIETPSGSRATNSFSVTLE